MKHFANHHYGLYHAIKTGKAWDRLVSPPNVAPPMTDDAKCYGVACERYSAGTSDRIMRDCKSEGSGLDPTGLLYRHSYEQGLLAGCVNPFGPEVRS